MPLWLIITVCGVFLVRIPSFFAPYYYGDEMIYLNLGEAIRRGLVLYKDIHDNKTPFIYFLGAIAGNVFWFHAILCIWMIVTIILFWRLTIVLFPKNNKLQKIITIVFAITTSLPLLEGQIANSELFMIGPTILAFIFALKKEDRVKNLFISGVCISLATLFKIPAAFDIGAIILLVVLSLDFSFKDFKKKLFELMALFVGFLIPILLTFVWYSIRGALGDYINAAFLQNLGYVASWRTGSIQNQVPFLVKNGPILIRASIVAVSFIILFLLRKKLPKPFLISVAWLLTSLFAATLSERPYPHYLVQALPAFSILVGILLSTDRSEQALTVIPLALAFFVPVYYKYWYYPTVPYFTNFAAMFTENNKSDYLKLFGPRVVADYNISKSILTMVNNTDPVFVWGDAPPIYALTRTLPPIKYVTNYHIFDYSNPQEVVSGLSRNMPRLIIILPGDPVPTELYSFIKQYYHSLGRIEDADFWYNNGK